MIAEQWYFQSKQYRVLSKNLLQNNKNKFKQVEDHFKMYKRDNIFNQILINGLKKTIETATVRWILLSLLDHDMTQALDKWFIHK